MGWSAVDIRNQRFRKRWWGYDPEEVHLFLNILADEIERLTQMIRQLEHENRQLHDRLEEYREKERHLRNTLVAAQQTADRVREQARRDAEIIVREAEFRRDQILAVARQQLHRIQMDIDQLFLEYRRWQEQILAETRTLIDWIEQRQQQQPPARVQIMTQTDPANGRT